MMDDEKLQDLSKETENKTPEEIQNNGTSIDENQQEKVEEKTKDHVAEEPDQEEATNTEKNQLGSEQNRNEIENATEQEEEEEEEEELDMDDTSKKELVAKIKEIRNEDDIQKINSVLKAVKPRFDELYELSKNKALQTFVSEGNEVKGFQYHGDELDKEFTALYNQLKAKKNKHYKELENEKENNLKKKTILLEKLREIVDGEESPKSISLVREIQAEWKKEGLVVRTHNKTLWASYKALLDRYYDNRSIYFELKDLDRKKNMNLKVGICEKAEALLEVENRKSAIIRLNELHDEYRHIGPVPLENQESLWQRFKAASDVIYVRNKHYFEELKLAFEDNLIKKNELIKEVEQFTQFNSDRITEWNNETRKILEVQKKWEAIGSVPKEKAKTVNKAFWNTFKSFFVKKTQFFKELESKREENLVKKQKLIDEAVALQESLEWNSVADKLKHFQLLWKDIGPVPEKVRNETYKKFKDACDHFFNRRRVQNQEQQKGFVENQNLKTQIGDQLEEMAQSEEVDLEKVYDLIDNYTAIGFVPKNSIKPLRERFDKIKTKLLANEAISEEEKTDLRSHMEIGKLRNSPDGERKIQQKEYAIKRKISILQNDITLWTTNMEFFVQSASSDKLKMEMQERVDKAQEELEKLKSQLSAIS